VRGALEQAGPGTEVKNVKVGVTFRTDSNGQAHVDHDCKAVEAMNQLQGMPVRVEAVTLPRGARGGATPPRAASASDLADIDMLYIPGAPTANDTQTGMDGESRDLNVPQPPGGDPGPGPVEPVKGTMEKRAYNLAYSEWQRQNKEYKPKKQSYDAAVAKYQRIKGEHDSRAAYELKLIAMARTRGIPTIAICAGSWRLLEAYGGEVETLPEAERALHKAPEQGDTWKIGHGIKVEEESLLGGMTGGGMMTDVNSTHWAVASTTESGRLRQRANAPAELDPGELLDVSAVATGMALGPPPATATDKRKETELPTESVEAFESRMGVPTLGIQWHPEAYLPGMQGEQSGSPEAQQQSRAIFSAMAQAAAASGGRRHGVNEQITAGARVEADPPAPDLLKRLGRVDGERKAFEMLGQALEAVLDGKPVSAGELYKGAAQELPMSYWSGPVEELDQAMTQLGRALELEEQQKPQEAAELRQSALETMQRHGFGAH
jgi:gamma-glutamyl-gamma-aminobutyrate hydrolase PuuD